MIQIITFIFLMFNSFMFLIMNHPLTMGLILMMQTLLIALFSGTYTATFWFSYSLFLIFMGGMLILFMYMTSLASNEIFKFSINKKNLLLTFLLLLILTIYYYNSEFKTILMNNKLLNNENNSFLMMKTLIDNNNLMLNKMYNFPMNMITILLIFYLFLTLIASVKISNIFKGPLRPKNN